MIYKKVFGTLTLLALLAVSVFSTYSYVSANANPQSNHTFDGIVLSAFSDSITIITANEETIRIYINEKTNYTEQLEPEDIRPGDRLRINAKGAEPEIIAKVVKRISCNSGYGH